MSKIRDKKIQIRVAETEKALIESKAKNCNMTASDFLRAAALSDKKVCVLAEGAEIVKLLIGINNSLKDSSKNATNNDAPNILQGIEKTMELLNTVSDKLTDIHMDNSETADPEITNRYITHFASIPNESIDKVKLGMAVMHKFNQQNINVNVVIGMDKNVNIDLVGLSDEDKETDGEIIDIPNSK